MVTLKTKYINISGFFVLGIIITLLLQQQNQLKRELAVVQPIEAKSMEPSTSTPIEMNTSTTKMDTEINEGTKETASNQNQSNLFYSYEGKVVEYTPNSITIEVPIDGKQTFTINGDTFIKQEDGINLAVGEFVDIDANGNIAYKIETERVIEGVAVIKAIESNQIILERNGKQSTFQKASQFYIDTDGYNGSLVGFPAEYTITKNNQIISLEVDFEYDYDD